MTSNPPEVPVQPGVAARILVSVVKGARRFYGWATLAGTASAVATLVVLIATLLGETTAELVDTYHNFTALAAVEPWWTRAVLFVPLPVWWLLTVAFAVAVWLYCVRSAKQRDSIWIFFVPPVLLLALSYVVSWALYTPIRTAF